MGHDATNENIGQLDSRKLYPRLLTHCRCSIEHYACCRNIQFAGSKALIRSRLSFPHGVAGTLLFQGAHSEEYIQSRAICICLLYYVVNAVRSNDDNSEWCIENLVGLIRIKTQQLEGSMNANVWIY